MLALFRLTVLEQSRRERLARLSDEVGLTKSLWREHARDHRFRQSTRESFVGALSLMPVWIPEAQPQ